MKTARDMVVTMHYTLTDDAGTVLDSSSGSEPLSYLHGHGNIIPGLEQALEGCEPGYKDKISLAAEDGYGERRDDMLVTAPREQFDPSMKLETGLQVMAQGPSGPVVFTIQEIGEEEVVLDGNHPLAGQPLHFDVEVTDVRAATEEELEHGHVHGAGGEDHDEPAS